MFSSWTEKYKEREVDQLKRLEEISGQTDVESSQPSQKANWKAGEKFVKHGDLKHLKSKIEGRVIMVIITKHENVGSSQSLLNQGHTPSCRAN